MMNSKRKKLRIFIGGGALLLAGAIWLLCALLFREPDPAAVLDEAQTLTEQNLCLRAILEKEPQNQSAKEQLLANLAALEADPLTIAAAEQAYGLKAPAQSPKPEPIGAITNAGGIARIKDCEGAYSAAEGNGTVYYATDQGIYAEYRGIRVRISAARADQLYATENGLYFLNLAQRRVQYVARDGHKVLTLSETDAQSFAFFEDSLWIATPAGALYCAGEPIKTPAPIRALTVANNALYASFEQEGKAGGILSLTKTGGTILFSSPAHSLSGGSDGNLYYLNNEGYPCKFDPIAKNATILAEKEARILCYEQDALYYMNTDGDIKKIA